MNEDKVLGCLGGLAMGDAFGNMYAPDSKTDKPCVTANAWMAMLVADSLADVRPGLEAADEDRQDKDIIALMDDLSAKLVAFLHSDRSDGTSFVTFGALEALAGGRRWDATGMANIFGAEPLARAAPLGLYFRDPLSIQRFGMPVTQVTHAEDAVVCAAVAGAMLCHFAANDVGVGTWALELMTVAGGIDEDLDKVVKKAASAAASGAALPFAEPRLASEVVAAAVFHCMRNPSSPLDALAGACEGRGDSAAVGALVGAMMGAKVGFAKLPEDWRNMLAFDDDCFLAPGRRLAAEPAPLAIVKKLRAELGPLSDPKCVLGGANFGMVECKRALELCGNDYEKAKEWLLRESGKKEDKPPSEAKN